MLLFLVSAFALFSNIIRFVVVARTRLLNTGAAIAHLGLAMMMVGIVSSSAWDVEKELNLPLGHPVEAMDRTFTYRGHVDGSEPKDLWRVAVLTPGKGEITGLARMYRFKSGGDYQVMRNPAIMRSLAQDLYIAPLALETGASTKPLTLTKGSPVPFNGGQLEFVEFKIATNPEGGHAGAMQIDGIVQLTDDKGETTELVLSTDYAGGESNPTPVELKSWPGTTLAMDRISVDTGSIQVLVKSGGGAETLVVSVTHKPLMNLLWTGTILLLVGCTVAAIRRYADKNIEDAQQSVAA